jgi:hypothetical protein
MCGMRKWMMALLLGSTACDNQRVGWSEPQGAAGDSLGALAVDASGAPVFGRAAVLSVVPPDSAACPGSLATASKDGAIYATWLRVRPDSSVRVMAARLDGTQWTRPAIVDSLDVGRMGCRRPPPAIVVNDGDGYVHIAYSLRAPEGFGVFFSHSMDNALSFHTPMIVVYGDRLSSTAIAAHGMRVAIAYEDPSGAGRRVNVALSSTQGHSFEPREQATPDEIPATRPRIAIRDTIVALTFAGADSAHRAILVGTIRR